MFAVYIVLIAIFAILGLVCLIAGLEESDLTAILMGIALLILIPLVVLVPHSTDFVYTPYVIRTDTYNNIKYDRVVRVEYDIRKGPWWSWEGTATIQNLKIITEDK